MGLYYHLSGEEKEFAKKKSLFCLIIYDILLSMLGIEKRLFV